MRSTTCLPIAAAFLLGLASADAAAAQDAAACTYQTCALRLEAGFFGSRIVRGATGESVIRIGPFGEKPSMLIDGPDSAAAYARRYVADVRRADVVSTLGAFAMVAGVIFASRRSDLDTSVGAVAMLGGVTITIASIPLQLRAQRNLARSIWWYNASLPR